jgi:hypothetical protein
MLNFMVVSINSFTCFINIFLLKNTFNIYIFLSYNWEFLRKQRIFLHDLGINALNLFYRYPEMGLPLHGCFHRFAAGSRSLIGIGNNTAPVYVHAVHEETLVWRNVYDGGMGEVAFPHLIDIIFSNIHYNLLQSCLYEPCIPCFSCNNPKNNKDGQVWGIAERNIQALLTGSFFVIRGNFREADFPW